MMIRTRSIAALTAALAVAALAACAAPAGPTTAAGDAPAGSCAQLDADISQTDEALRAAQAKGQDAWKAVVPFAVAARYASGKAAANDAAQQLDALRAEAARLGCPGQRRLNATPPHHHDTETPMTRLGSFTLAIAVAALTSSIVLISHESAHAQTPHVARGATVLSGPNAAAAGQRGAVSDGQGNVAAGSRSAFTTANGSHGQRTARVTRSADGTASAERNTTAMNAATGVTFDANTTYTKGSGVSRSAGCTDAAGNAVTCGSGR